MVGGLLHIVCSAWNVIFSWASSGVSLVVGGGGGCLNIIFNIINAVLGWG